MEAGGGVYSATWWGDEFSFLLPEVWEGGRWGGGPISASNRASTIHPPTPPFSLPLETHQDPLGLPFFCMLPWETGKSSSLKGIFHLWAICAINMVAYFDGRVLCTEGLFVTSDERIKTNMADIYDNDALSQFRLLQPKTYEYKDKAHRGSSRVLGFQPSKCARSCPRL